jgi:hypothetical protein
VTVFLRSADVVAEAKLCDNMTLIGTEKALLLLRGNEEMKKQ